MKNFLALSSDEARRLNPETHTEKINKMIALDEELAEKKRRNEELIAYSDKLVTDMMQHNYLNVSPFLKPTVDKIHHASFGGIQSTIAGAIKLWGYGPQGYVADKMHGLLTGQKLSERLSAAFEADADIHRRKLRELTKGNTISIPFIGDLETASIWETVADPSILFPEGKLYGYGIKQAAKFVSRNALKDLITGIMRVAARDDLTEGGKAEEVLKNVAMGAVLSGLGEPLKLFFRKITRAKAPAPDTVPTPLPAVKPEPRTGQQVKKNMLTKEMREAWEKVGLGYKNGGNSPSGAPAHLYLFSHANEKGIPVNRPDYIYDLLQGQPPLQSLQPGVGAQ